MSKILFSQVASYANCPNCKNADTLHESRTRNLKEKLIRATKLYAIYRCKTCGWRGYSMTVVITTKGVKLFLMYLAVALLSGLIVREILKRFLKA